jgi:hypothetical protein
VRVLVRSVHSLISPDEPVRVDVDLQGEDEEVASNGCPYFLIRPLAAVEVRGQPGGQRLALLECLDDHLLPLPRRRDGVVRDEPRNPVSRERCAQKADFVPVSVGVTDEQTEEALPREEDLWLPDRRQ